MNDTKLENLNVSLEDLCCFLIPLFYETDYKYSCSRTKIGKLLSILAFKYAMNGKQLFYERIYKYDECGTSVGGIMNLLGREEYFNYPYQDDKKYINDELKASDELPKRWQRVPKLSFEIMRDTIDVFRRFGAYSQSDLSEVLNPIVDKLTNESYGIIDLSKIPYISDEVDQDNEVVKYLKSSYISNEAMNNLNAKTKVKKI